MRISDSRLCFCRSFRSKAAQPPDLPLPRDIFAVAKSWYQWKFRFIHLNNSQKQTDLEKITTSRLANRNQIPCQLVFVLIFFVLFRWVLFGQERWYPGSRSVGRFRYRRNRKNIQNFCNHTIPQTDSASLIHIIFTHRERRSRKNFSRRRTSLRTTMIADEEAKRVDGRLPKLRNYPRAFYTTPARPRRRGQRTTPKTDNI